MLYVTMLLHMRQMTWYDKTTQHWTQANTQHFQIFFSSFNQIEQFLCHWKCKLEDYKCSISTKSKGARKKTQGEKEVDYDILFQNFWRKNFRPFLVSNPIFSSFLIHFEWYKNRWVHQLAILKKKFFSKGKKITKK